MNKNEIAVVGATGNVGRKIVDFLLQKKLGMDYSLRLLASPASAGKQVQFLGRSFQIEDLSSYSFENCSVALFATESDISKKHLLRALEAGAKVIDSSSLYRLDPSVPLIVPPVNSDLISANQKLYSIANCVACPMSVVLKPLHNYARIRRVVASSYQSVSGAGKAAMDELDSQTRALYQNQPLKQEVFNRRIAFNVIPQVDRILPSGFTNEEFKIMEELKKVVSPEIKVMVTSVRVPVMVGHSVSLAVEFEKQIQLEEIKSILKKSSFVRLSDQEYATPLEVEGRDDVTVGRLRLDPTVQNGIGMWLASDNLRRGAALDAVEVCERILQL